MKQEYSVIITNILGLTAFALVAYGIYSWICVGITFGPFLSIPIVIAGLLSIALSCLEYDAKDLQAYPRRKPNTINQIQKGAKS